MAEKPKRELLATRGQKTLRDRAEARMRASRTEVAGMSKDDILSMFHELQVHQVELQMQNEELRLTELKLTQSRDRYSFLYDFAPVAYITLSPAEDRIVEANLTAATLLGVGRKALLENKFSNFVAWDAQDTWYLHHKAVCSSETQQSCELPMHRVDGTPLFVRLESIAFASEDDHHCHIALIDITERRQIEQQRLEFSQKLEQKVSERTEQLAEANRALLKDMEERKKLEDQLRQSQKMESMGTLAAGIAHDLNNILNIIQGYAIVLERGAKPEEIQESVDAITETTKRCGVLVQQLLTLARKTGIRLETTNVNALIRELSNLVKETFPKNIELALELDRSLPSITADPNQITQVLLNLAVNARDAMPDGGRLTIKTRVVDREGLRELSGVTSERYVCIEVADTGKGMDDNVQGRIFEPFFTTKGIGQGTGLGLAVVYGIVKSHNGFIEVESRPMVGTTFHLRFPVQSAGG
jgi:signal transduction histidine kinase